MFDSLTDKFNKAISSIKGKSVITEKDFEDFTKILRRALLEADVALAVVKEFIENVKAEVIGKAVIKKISRVDTITKIVKDELVKSLGGANSAINFNKDGTTVIMMVGLQGSGKTTTSAKLALFLKKRQKKKVLLSSLDVYRPAAQTQLELLAKQIAIDSVSIINGENPQQICKRTMQINQENKYDVVILDTAGRLHIDNELMNELREVKDLTHPEEIILVVDSMIGQESLNVSKKFHEELALTGLIMTRIDSDTRGGGALSMRHATGAPIKFLGSGETVCDIEEFHPERVANRILGMGDIDSLMERASAEIGEDKIDSLKEKLDKGKFDFNDLLYQFKTVSKLGGIAKILKFIPGMNKIPADQIIDETVMKKNLAMIYSMTKQERKNPDIINQSRKNRIAKGAAVKMGDINKLMKNFAHAKSMAMKFSMGGFSSIDKNSLNNLFKK